MLNIINKGLNNSRKKIQNLIKKKLESWQPMIGKT